MQAYFWPQAGVCYSRVNWEEFVHCQVRINETYSEVKRQFSVRNRDVHINAHSLHKWSSTSKSALFGLSSSLPPLVGWGGGLVCELVPRPICCQIIWTRESVDLPLTCHPSLSLITLAFKSSVIRCLLLDMDPYVGNDSLGVSFVFLSFCSVSAACFLGSFQACWRQDNVTPIPKGTPSTSVAIY